MFGCVAVDAEHFNIGWVHRQFRGLGHQLDMVGMERSFFAAAASARICIAGKLGRKTAESPVTSMPRLSALPVRMVLAALLTTNALRGTFCGTVSASGNLAMMYLEGFLTLGAGRIENAVNRSAAHARLRYCRHLLPRRRNDHRLAPMRAKHTFSKNLGEITFERLAAIGTDAVALSDSNIERLSLSRSALAARERARGSGTTPGAIETFLAFRSRKVRTAMPTRRFNYCGHVFNHNMAFAA